MVYLQSKISSYCQYIRHIKIVISMNPSIKVVVFGKFKLERTMESWEVKNDVGKSPMLEN